MSATSEATLVEDDENREQRDREHDAQPVELDQQTVELQRMLEDLKEILAEFRSEGKSLQQQVREYQSRQNELEESRRALQEQQDSLCKQRDELNADWDNLQMQRDEVDLQRAELEAQRRRLEEEHKALVGAAIARVGSRKGLPGAESQPGPKADPQGPSDQPHAEPNAFRSAIADAFQLPENAATQDSEPTGTPASGVPSNRSESDESPPDQQAVDLTTVLSSLSSSDPDSENPSVSQPPQGTASGTQSESTLLTGSPGMDGSSASPEPSAQTGDYYLEDAEDVESISAYMERLLARTRREDSGQALRHGYNSARRSSGRSGQRSSIRANRTRPSSLTSPETAKVADASSTELASSGVTRRSLDKEAVRADLDSLRELANLSARSAIAKYTWRRVRAMLVVKALLTVVAFALAAVLLTGGLWNIISYETLGWSAIAIGTIAALELLRSAAAIHRQHAESKQKTKTGDGDSGEADDPVCEFGEPSPSPSPPSPSGDQPSVGDRDGDEGPVTDEAPAAPEPDGESEAPEDDLELEECFVRGTKGQRDKGTQRSS